MALTLSLATDYRRAALDVHSRRAVWACRVPQHIVVGLQRGVPPTCLNSCRIRDAFDAVDNQLADAPEGLYVAICSEDSSIVYYKISKGIMKPQV